MQSSLLSGRSGLFGVLWRQPVSLYGITGEDLLDCFYSFTVSQNHLVTLYMFHRTRVPPLTLKLQEGKWKIPELKMECVENRIHIGEIIIYILRHLSDAIVTFSNSYTHWCWWLPCKVSTRTSGAVWGSASCPRTLGHGELNQQHSGNKMLALSLIHIFWLVKITWTQQSNECKTVTIIKQFLFCTVYFAALKFAWLWFPLWVLS